MGGSSEALVLWSEDRASEVDVALAGFLAGYSGNTRLAYQQDLRQFVSWCYDQELGLFAVRRTHIELFARWLEHRGAARATIGRRLSTVTGCTDTASKRSFSPTTRQRTSDAPGCDTNRP
jgi:hypothetical protein